MREASISESALTLPAVKRGIPLGFYVIMVMAIGLSAGFAGGGLALYLTSSPSHLKPSPYPHQVRSGGRADASLGPAATRLLVRFEGEGR